jgi:putative thioredoxin
VLGPAIERVAAEFGGDVALAKLNTDENPRTATAYRIQSIPAVKAFRNGEVAAEFVGALPEPQVRQFFARLVPSEAEKLAREGIALAETDAARAEVLLRSALEKGDPGQAGLVALARLAAARGAEDEALALCARMPANREAKALTHAISLRRFAAGKNGASLAAEATANPRDPRAHYRLGLWHASQADYEAALDALLESIRLDRRFEQEAARKAVLGVFDILGPEAELTRAYQRRLAAVLF